MHTSFERRVGRGILILFVALAALWAGGEAVPTARAGGSEEIEAAWVQLGPGGQASARAVTRAATCPTLWLDDRAVRMGQRAAPNADFPVRVCETLVPAGTESAWVAGRWLPLPVALPRNIVVVGDTGCRLKEGSPIQACNDPDAWPWATVADAAAPEQPDLVIHVGDYIYRDMACPATSPGCAGSPWGSNWATWEADFFDPAGSLLRAAPWIVTRGNHEDCARHGPGWFRFLDPGPVPADCADYTDPYVVPAGEMRLLMLDSANAADSNPDPAQVALYRAQLDDLTAQAGEEAWFITHRPFWAVGQAPGQDSFFKTNETLQAASGNQLPDSIRFVLSGHLHLFDAFGFADGRPPQFVVGQSGTALDPPLTLPLVGTPLGGTEISEGLSVHEFGYFVLQPAASGWSGTVRDSAGRSLAWCDIGWGAIHCTE